MLCQNCGKKEVTFRYTQIINGVKKEMALCHDCAKSLGLEESLDFNMPINFSSFLGDFLSDAFSTKLMPSFTKTDALQCNSCGMTYDEFVNNGKFGCSHCYDIFADNLDSVLKHIHGSSNHIGRRSHLTEADKKAVKEDVNKTQKVEQKNETNKQINPKEEKLEKLNQDLKQAIQEERYEDAAKIRDEIKKIS